MSISMSWGSSVRAYWRGHPFRRLRLDTTGCVNSQEIFLELEATFSGYSGREPFAGTSAGVESGQSKIANSIFDYERLKSSQRLAAKNALALSRLALVPAL